MQYLDRERKYDNLVLPSASCPALESPSVRCHLLRTVTTDIGSPCVDDGGTAMYDAWTAYSGGCDISTTTGDLLKRPEEEHTKENREIAFSFVPWRVVEALFADH